MKTILRMGMAVFAVLIITSYIIIYLMNVRSGEAFRKNISHLYGREFATDMYVFDDVTADKKDLIWNYFLGDSFSYFINTRYANMYRRIDAVDAEICLAYQKLRNDSDGSPRDINPLGIKDLTYDNNGNVIWVGPYVSNKATLGPYMKNKDDVSRILNEYIQFLHTPIPKTLNEPN